MKIYVFIYLSYQKIPTYLSSLNKLYFECLGLLNMISKISKLLHPSSSCFQQFKNFNFSAEISGSSLEPCYGTREKFVFSPTVRNVRYSSCGLFRYKNVLKNLNILRLFIWFFFRFLRIVLRCLGIFLTLMIGRSTTFLEKPSTF